MSVASVRVPARLRRAERGLWLAGGLLLAACAAGAILAPGDFYPSYLFAFLFWLGITLGAVAILFLHDLTGGAWGNAVRELLESAVAPLTWLPLFFLPLPFGLARLYVWARPAAVAADAELRAKSAWLAPSPWIVRAIVYFALWWALAFLLRRRARARRSGRAPDGRAWSGPALIVWSFAVTFAAFDWAMSLEPHWHSTIYGALVMVEQALGALAVTIACAGAAVRLGGLPPPAEEAWNDLGNLLLTFVMLWGYLQVSQLVIIWSGNLPVEIPWYLRRTAGGWVVVTFVLVAFQFTLPFLLLLSRRVKRSARLLPRLAAAIAVADFVSVFWRVVPGARPGALAIHWMDVAAPLAIGAVWTALFLRTLASGPASVPAVPVPATGERHP